ncbi:DUF4430 domain-containing protein [Bacillus ndiopicus]|uniref:DUF4430 domain-containing protein n=1 Tax=Bacillus ndiopicus TaxID=1347368 RepID=UPI0006943BF2|nr:DUF4430 domain-containing protein [Bacillus ndiopicus]
MKKTLHFLFVSLLAIFLVACNIQTVEQFEQMQEQERSVDAPSTIKQPEIDKQTSSEKQEPTEQKQEVKKPEEDKKAEIEVQAEPQQQAKQETKQPQQKQETEKKQEVAKSPSTKTEQPKANDKQKTNSATPPVEKPKEQITEKQQQPAPQKRTVTIAIRVDTLLKHWDKLDPALQSEKYVPQNGIILKPTTYELLSEKDTVWDVLQRATKEHKIQMEYQGANENIYNSVYVEGINHLYEFSAGELSGWMYKVNGVYPNYGCSQYVLKDGDIIEWNYTVDLGRDLGHYWDGN